LGKEIRKKAHFLFPLIIKLKNIKEKGEKRSFSLRDYFSVKEGCCGMQAGENSLTDPVLNKIFVWLRSKD